MSAVDERIVQMQFDNKQFESNVQTSLKSLEQLKSGLKLDASAKSLAELDRAGKSFNLNGIADGVQTISSKFSALGIMGVTALMNITNAAMNAGAAMVKSLTTEPVMDGLREYETKMNSITTILTNTASKGTTLDDVNVALSQLNDYADQTIYNFAEMTRNIGTFTAAGVDLDTSVSAIKGIANLAAGSGSSAQQAATAMYQLSQAIATGSVKLQDWNSVVNAGMGGELFQNALKESAKELGIFVDEAVPFRETLKDGWLTTEVLMKTLNRFAEDEALVKAATQVKTFTQLFDTMKESVGSGWAVSWEHIIGDREQATEMLTDISDAFNNLIGPSTDARNAMLKFWNENGGRDAVIDAVTNAFKGLQSILSPVMEAFKEVFPPMTGERLVELSKGLKDLTSNFKIGEQTAQNIKSTFKGLFAVVDLGAQGFTALLGGFGQLLGAILPAGDGLLGFTAAIGDYIVGLNEAAKETDFFKNAVEKFIGFFKSIPTTVANVASEFAKGFERVTGIDLKLPSLQSFYDLLGKLKDRMPTLGDAFKAAKDGISGFLSSFVGIINVEKVGEAVGKAVNGIREAIKTIGGLVSTGLESLGFDNLWDAVNGGIFAGILLAIKQFASSLSDPLGALTDLIKGVGDGASGILDSVKGSLEAYQNSIQANTLLKIAAAIAVLAAAITVISMLDPGAVTKSLGAITVLFVDLFASMAIFQKLMSGTDLSGMTKATTAMIGMSTAVLILANAVAELAALDWDGLVKGLLGVAGLTAILVVAANELSKVSGKLISSSIGLIAFGAAINVMVQAVEALGALDTASLVKGLIGVGVLVTEIALFLKVTDLDGMGVLKGVGLIALAAAINVLAAAAGKFGSMDINSLIKGLAGVGVVLAELALFVNLTGNASKVTSTAVGLTVLSAAMLIMAEAVKSFGSMSWETIAKGLTAMAGSLAAITIAIQFMPATLPLIGVGLVAVAAALNILSSALSSMGSMSWEGIAKSLVTLAGSLTIIATAMQFMTTALPGAAALLVISAALAIFAPVLAALGSMSLGEIGTALLTLAGVFTVLGVAGYALGPVTPVILALSVALALMGAAAVAFGIGATAIAAAITALAATTVAAATGIVAALSIIVVGIADLIPTVCQKLGEGIVAFAAAIANGSVAITAAVVVVIAAIVDALVQSIPTVVNGVMQLIMALLQAILQYGPQIITTVVQIIAALLQALGAAIPTLINAGIQLMVSFINGMANGIRDNTETVFAAVRNLMSSIIEFAIAALAELVRMIPVVGNKMEEGLTAAKEKVREVLAPESMAEIGSDAMDATASGISQSTPEVQNAATEAGTSASEGLTDGLAEAFDIGALGGTDFASGLMGTSSIAEGSGAELSGTMLQGLSSNQLEYSQLGGQFGLDFTDNLGQTQSHAEGAGKEIAESAISGIGSNESEYKEAGEEYGTDFSTALADTTSSAESAGEEVAAGAEEGVKENIKEFETAGSEAGEGFVIGLLSQKNNVASAGLEIGNTALASTREALNSHSPSKETEEIGEDYDQGFVNGITGGTDGVVNAATSLGTKAVEGLKSQKDSFFDYGTETATLFINGLTSMGEAIKASVKTAFATDEETANYITSTLDEALKTIEQRIDSYTELATDRFNKISTESEISVAEMIENLRHNQVVIGEWAENIALLADRGLNEGLLEQLRQAGPKSAGEVKALVAASDAELQQLNVAFGKGGQVATQALVTSVGEAAPLLVEPGQNIVDALAQGLVSSTSLNDAMATLIGSAKNVGAKDLGDFADIGGQLSQEFSKGIEKNATSAGTAGTKVTQSAEQGLKSNQAVYGQTGDKYGTDFSTNLSNKQTASKTSGTNVTTSAEQGLKSNAAVWGQTGDKYGADFANNLDNKKTAAKTAATQLTKYAEDGLKSNSDVFGKTGAKYGEEFSSKLAEKAPAAKEAGTTVATRGSEGIASLNTPNGPFFQAGVNAAQGFIDGILSMVEEAAAAAAELAREAMEAAMDELDEHSPSKEMEKVGVNFDLGFINGIRKLAGAAASMAAGVGRGALDAMKDAIAKVSDVVNSDIDSSPTIRPVLDLTEIQNGVSSINRMFGGTKGLVVAGANANAITVANTMKPTTKDPGGSVVQQPAQGNHYEFNQYNTSPKALSRLELYRQSKNLFALQKGLVEGK